MGTSSTSVRSLTILDFGRADIDMGVVMAPGDLDGVRAICHFPGFLIELDDNRRILFDSGPHRRHITEPMFEYRGTGFSEHLMTQLTPADDPLNRLAEVGLTPDDIAILVVTHCHFDHNGNTADFPRAEIVIHRDAFADGVRRRDNRRPGWLPETDASGVRLTYRVIDTDTELAPGLTLIETPGHAPGHLSALVTLPETGPIILAIDAIYSQIVRERANYRIAADPAQALASANHLIALAEATNALIIYGHDPHQWETLKKSPATYR